MNLTPYLKNNLLSIKVIPNAKHTELKEENGKLKLYVHAPPEKDKANKEVIKFFKKEYGLHVEIKSGEKSREKVLRINSFPDVVLGESGVSGLRKYLK